MGAAPVLRISTARHTYGARFVSGQSHTDWCYLCGKDDDRAENVRLNIDGVYTVLCERCRFLVVATLQNPEPCA